MSIIRTANPDEVTGLAAQLYEEDLEVSGTSGCSKHSKTQTMSWRSTRPWRRKVPMSRGLRWKPTWAGSELPGRTASRCGPRVEANRPPQPRLIIAGSPLEAWGGDVEPARFAQGVVEDGLWLRGARVRVCREAPLSDRDQRCRQAGRRSDQAGKAVRQHGAAVQADFSTRGASA